jgi:hypothetical protein
LTDRHEPGQIAANLILCYRPAMDKFPKMAEERLSHEVPGFIKAVRHDKATRIVTTLMAFNEDPMLLYMAVWYATTNGKSISFADISGSPGVKASEAQNSN